MIKFTELLQKVYSKDVTEEMAIELYDSYKEASFEGQDNINKKFEKVTGWNVSTLMKIAGL